MGGTGGHAAREGVGWRGVACRVGVFELEFLCGVGVELGGGGGVGRGWGGDGEGTEEEGAAFARDEGVVFGGPGHFGEVDVGVVAEEDCEEVLELGGVCVFFAELVEGLLEELVEG